MTFPPERQVEMNASSFSKRSHYYFFIAALISTAALFSARAGMGQTSSKSQRNNYVVSVQELKMAGKSHAAFDKGSQLLEKGETAKSVAYLQQAIADYPEHYKAYYDLGVAQYRLSHLEEAEQAFQKAIDITKGHFAPPQFGLGAILCQKSEFPQAESLLQRALDVDPGSAVGKYYLAWAQFGLNRLAEAERTLEQALLRNEKLAEAYLLLARVHQRQRNVPAVTRDLEFYVKLDPHKEQAKSWAAQIEHEMGLDVVATATP